jgi:lipoprotein-releasing system permease protein
MQVLNNREQHASLLKALKVEKLFVFITFSFILLLASFNIFFSLSLLAIEKKRDIAMLFAMGASEGMVKRIFLLQGVLTAFTGAGAGLLTGVLICLLQQEFGLVSMGAESSILQAYPVDLRPADLLLVFISLVSITLLISFRPAYLAAKTGLIPKL